ncbi:MAG: rhomboid family intramembrane serine protease [Terracidiphilus sp.]
MGSGPVSPPPEILPPEGAPAAAPTRPRRRWAAAWATYLLVGINCAVFLLMVLRGSSIWMPNADQLMYWGADNAGSVLLGGQWWRIVTAMFVHVGIVHLATNMWCLWNLGLLAEPLMDWYGLIAVYLLTGAAGNLLSTLRNWWHFLPDWTKYHDFGVFPAGAGASGAVFGISGALIILLKSKRLPVPEHELKKLRKSVIYFAGINLIIGLSVNFGRGLTGIEIDNSAHIGGVLCGMLFAAPMVPRIGSPRPIFKTRIGLAIAAVVFLLVLFGFYLAQLPRG